MCAGVGNPLGMSCSLDGDIPGTVLCCQHSWWTGVPKPRAHTLNVAAEPRSVPVKFVFLLLYQSRVREIPLCMPERE